MGGVCLCHPWTCRPVWPVFVFLAAFPFVLRCSESPAAAVGKMYPRGNHWAVGKTNSHFIRNARKYPVKVQRIFNNSRVIRDQQFNCRVVYILEINFQDIYQDRHYNKFFSIIYDLNADICTCCVSALPKSFPAFFSASAGQFHDSKFNQFKPNLFCETHILGTSR